MRAGWNLLTNILIFHQIDKFSALMFGPSLFRADRYGPCCLMIYILILAIVIIPFCHNVLGTDVLMSILAVRKLYCSRTKSAPKVFVKKASENQ